MVQLKDFGHGPAAKGRAPGRHGCQLEDALEDRGEEHREVAAADVELSPRGRPRLRRGCSEMSFRHFRRFSERRSSERRRSSDPRHYGSIKEDGQGILQEDEEDSDGGGQGSAEQSTEAGGAPSTLPHAALAPNPETCFRDGIRKIDFVLVYEEPIGSGGSSAAPQDGGGADPGVGAAGGLLRSENTRSAKQEVWRQRFLDNLRRVGLEMEEEVVESDNKKLVHFLKLHATWPVMCHYAEELCMRAPLQIRSYSEAQPNPAENWSAWLLASLRLPNIMAEQVPGKALDFYTCPFRRSKIDRFLGSENQQTYFSAVQRSRVLYEVLSTAMFGKKKKGEVGIDRLVEEGVFSSAFSLHDGPYHDPNAVPGSPGGEGCTMNPRQVLYDYWARWGKWYKYQPLDHIREYFGEKIAIYFAWLGFYTGWLLPAALVGVLVFLYGLFTINENPLANQVCRSEGSFKMCPLCDEKIGCNYWDLSDVCGYARLAYLFDHPGTVFYAVFISLWAVTFLEYWKRKCASLAHHWDCTGFQEEEERPRPEFAARAPFLERNPVTGVREPSFPASLRHKRVAAGIGIIFLMMSLVIIFIVAVIIYRVLVSIPLFQNATFRSQAQSIANLTGAVVNLVLIMAMSRVYEKLAYRLTTWEMHRTQTEFDDNLTFKVFIFQFVNFYSSIFYIAFFKGRFVGYPGNYTHILRLRNEDCSAGGCLIELAQQLAVIMIGKQMINNAQELLVPKLKAWWQKKQVKLPRRSVRTRWEEDYQLIDSEGLFQEYLEMVLQFGFITIFVAAFPLAPLFALLNNWVEIRLDAHKLVCDTRRPVAERAEHIGIWFKILNMLAHLAVISNGFLIAFTSEFLPKLLYQYEYAWNLEGYVNFTLSYSPEGNMNEQCRYRGMRDPEGKHTPFFWRLLAVRFAFVIIFEHVVFGICRLIDILVPDIPESLELKIKRERYLAKQALQDSDTILRVATNQNEETEPAPPFGGMVLDLTSELGALMPPLLIAAPSSSELAKAAQEALAGPSVLRDLVKGPSVDKNRAPRPCRNAPQDNKLDPSTQRRPSSLRGRPRPRPRTMAEAEPETTKTSVPRHSMSATAIASHRQASAENSGANSGATSRSPQSVPESSVEYTALHYNDDSLRIDIEGEFQTSGEEGEDEATDMTVSRRKARITVKRRDRPVSAFVGEVIHKDGEVREVLRRSVPSKLDHVVLTMPSDQYWPGSSSLSETSSGSPTDDRREKVLGTQSLANAAAKCVVSVVSVHVPPPPPSTSPMLLTTQSVGSDLSSLVSQDPDSFSDLHLRHGSPKKTPTRMLSRPPPQPQKSDSLGSDISSLAGQDAEPFPDLSAQQWGRGAARCEDDHVELRVTAPTPVGLQRTSSSRAPPRERRMPPREQSVSVTSALGVAVEGGEQLLRHAAACTDITRVPSHDGAAFPVTSPVSETWSLSSDSLEVQLSSSRRSSKLSLNNHGSSNPEFVSTTSPDEGRGPVTPSRSRECVRQGSCERDLAGFRLSNSRENEEFDSRMFRHNAFRSVDLTKRAPPPPPPRKRLAGSASVDSCGRTADEQHKPQ